MTAYTIPEDITHETTASDGSAVVVTFSKGEVVPADAREEALLASLAAAGIATPVMAKATTKQSKTAPSESKE